MSAVTNRQGCGVRAMKILVMGSGGVGASASAKMPSQDRRLSSSAEVKNSLAKHRRYRCGWRDVRSGAGTAQVAHPRINPPLAVTGPIPRTGLGDAVANGDERALLRLRVPGSPTTHTPVFMRGGAVLRGPVVPKLCVGAVRAIRIWPPPSGSAALTRRPSPPANPTSTAARCGRRSGGTGRR